MNRALQYFCSHCNMTFELRTRVPCAKCGRTLQRRDYGSRRAEKARLELLALDAEFNAMLSDSEMKIGK